MQKTKASAKTLDWLPWLPCFCFQTRSVALTLVALLVN